MPLVRRPCDRRPAGRPSKTSRANAAVSPLSCAAAAVVTRCTASSSPRKESAGRSSDGHRLEQGDVPPHLKKAVRELRLRLGHSPLYRVVEVDPWSRIPERRHALMRFDP